jgi:hypothetical protein
MIGAASAPDGSIEPEEARDVGTELSLSELVERLVAEIRGQLDAGQEPEGDPA